MLWSNIGVGGEEGGGGIEEGGGGREEGGGGREEGGGGGEEGGGGGEPLPAPTVYIHTRVETWSRGYWTTNF